MINSILGLDAGTNSLGWSIRDKNSTDNQIVDAGVITFDKGVASEKGIEFPKVQKRTESRGTRRNYQAEKYRKYALLEFLIQKGMCPLSLPELDKWRNYRKGIKRTYPSSNKKFMEWLAYDFDGDGKPDFHLFNGSIQESYYLFRAKAASNEPNDMAVFKEQPNILGRVLYQINQRRGFKNGDSEETETILKGSEKTGTSGRIAIEDYLKRFPTLGSALYNYQKENGGRIRQRYNLRTDYENELKLISGIHGYTKEEYNTLYSCIIWQRPLRSQSHLIGNCIYERKKKRAPLSHPIYKEFKAWVFINNLKIIAPERFDQVQYLRDIIYPLFVRKTDFKISALLKKIHDTGGSITSNFGNPRMANESVPALSDFADYASILGQNWINDYGFLQDINKREKQQSKKTGGKQSIYDIWHVLEKVEDKNFKMKYALSKLKLNEEQAVKFSNMRLESGHATISISAIRKILPYLQQGILYSHAVFLANIENVIGRAPQPEEVAILIEIVKSIDIEHRYDNLLNEIIRSLILKRKSQNHNRVDWEINNIESHITAQDVDETLALIYKDRFHPNKGYFGNKNLTTDIWRKFKTDDEILKNANRGKTFFETSTMESELLIQLERVFPTDNIDIRKLWHPSKEDIYGTSNEYATVSNKSKVSYVPYEHLTSYLEKHPASDFDGQVIRLLGSPEPLKKGFKNPMALKTLHRLRHLINDLLVKGKIDENTKVVIEIARELNYQNERTAIRNHQKKQEIVRKKASELIKSWNEKAQTNYDEYGESNIIRIILWQEQNERCLYTGRTIQAAHVLDGAKYDIEHTIPASKSFDTEMKNLTLCDKHYNNTVKNNRIPYELDNYNDILNNVHFMAEHIEYWSKVEYKYIMRAKQNSDKPSKDDAIVKKHEAKFELKYWREKYNAFIITEYKPSWKNSQLRDTQIITKYARPYLKTIFKNVQVEKGIVVSHFKKIFQVQLDDKKNRAMHKHHAIDAAILTLIPQHDRRDFLLEKYFKKQEKNMKFHAIPDDYANFKAKHIIELGDGLIINKLTDDRTLIPTFKKYRSNGKIKTKDGNTIWQNGDTIRGQLHSESFYGAIKLPALDADGKIELDENQNIVLEDKISMVIRKPFKYKTGPNDTGFSSLEELEKIIVDKVLFKRIKVSIGNESFKDAMLKGIILPGQQNPIRRLRCFASSGNGLMKYETAVKVREHNISSPKEYKQFIYSVNATIPYCLLYINNAAKKTVKKIRPVALMELSKHKIKHTNEFFVNPEFSLSKVQKDNEEQMPLAYVLTAGQRVLFYNEDAEELRDVETKLTDRLFVMYQFETDGRIKFRHHMLAGELTEAKKAYKELSFFKTSDFSPLLRLRQANWNFLIENEHFKIEMDGSIIWL
jgi:CRISPR-associated endonuclease Csn1